MIAFMKLFMPYRILPMIFCVATQLEASPPDGQVTLPYQQFIELTRKPEIEPDVRPPVDAVLARADYLIDIRNGQTVVTVEWLAENFSDTWAWVAVAPLDLAIEPEGESTLVAHDGAIRLLMSETGSHRASARFSAPSGLGIAARFPILPATFNSIKISSDGKSADYQIDGATLLKDANGEIRYLLPANAHDVIIRKSESDDGVKVPTTWSVFAAAWVKYDAGWLDHEVRLSAIPTGGDGVNMQVTFPNSPSRIEVKSDGLLEFEKNDSGLLFRWNNRDAGERTITLRYRTQIAGDDTQWSVKIPEAEAGSTVVIAIPQGAEIAGDGWIQEPNPSRVPAWLRTQSQGQKIVMYSGKPPQVVVKWLPRFDTASMTINEAKISTRVVADGSQLTTTTYQITHAGGGSARWSLPTGMTLLGSAVAGVRVNPIDRDGALEFHLPMPAEGRPTTVAFSYTGSGKPLDRVAGGLVVETPSTPLFAHRIDWNIVLPDGTRLDAVESNAETAAAPANSTPGSAWLRRMFTRGEPLRAEVFYRSNNSDN
jgi:hypothetical protein